ncbi:MAG TPA: hypothetical protein VKZ58_10825 [Longimicrobiales bacterium]|nr:hypothetical protein [Longimicrobiales bacterium]
MRLRICVPALGLVLISAGPVAAQAWDTPSFLPPAAENSIGLYGIDPDPGNFGLMAIWRQTGRVNLGFRVGVFDVHDDVSGVIGAEASQLLFRATGRLPVDANWTLGVGGSIGDDSFVRVPIGITAGRRFTAGSFSFLPYVHPRIGFNWFTDDDDRGDDDVSSFEVGLTTDIGADLTFGRNFMVRFGAALGDFDSIGIGLAYRFRTPTAVSAK